MYMGEYEYEDEGLGKLKLKKIVRKVAAVTVGTALAPISAIAPKSLKYVGIKSKSSQKLARVAGIGTLAVGAAFVAAPMLGPAIAKSGSAVMGGFKFVAGKLKQAPKPAVDLLQQQGIDPVSAPPERVIQAGLESGSLLPETVQRAQEMTQGRESYYSPQADPDSGKTSGFNVGTGAMVGIAALGLGAFALLKKDD